MKHIPLRLVPCAFLISFNDPWMDGKAEILTRFLLRGMDLMTAFLAMDEPLNLFERVIKMKSVLKRSITPRAGIRRGD